MTDQFNSSYSFEDIQRYCAGEMSDAEMHQIELVALDDPFLSEAIEGYRLANFPLAKEQLLQISAELKSEKVIPKLGSPFLRNPWWRVAAILIIISGLVVLINYLSGIKKEKGQSELVQLQENLNTDPEFIPDSSAAIAKSEIDTTRKIPTKKLLEKERNLLADTKNESKPLPKNKISSDSFHSIPDEKSKRPINSFEESSGLASARALKTTDKVEMNAPIRFSGMVTNKMGRPLSNTLIIVKGVTAFYTGKSGKFSFNSPQDKVNIIVSSDDFKQKDTSINSNRFNIIRLAEQESLQDNAAVSRENSGKVIVMENASNSAFPAGGWSLFQTYVRERISLFSDSVHENVLVSFLIDELGRPYDLKVEAPAGAEAGILVENMLKEGPAWITNNQETRGSIIIKF